ncbi:MAG TPA: hypothetical protein PKM65_06965 [Spirochaetota bacterium]|nr:hypothetical protein [Spirochaetota bacterium]HNT09901.1 hypothetical protein [Spirochaetota bacterium]
MRTSSALCAVLALVLAFARTDTALPSDLPADIMFGVKGGYSQVIGHYADFVHGAGGGGVFVMPYIGSFFMIEADLSYASYALARERGSSLNLASGGSARCSTCSRSPFCKSTSARPSPGTISRSMQAGSAGSRNR